MPTGVPDIIACLVVYNDADLLPSCLRSLERADRIIVVDGAYEKYPHKEPQSTDGTLDLIKKLARNDKRIELIECDQAWKDEVDKRNAYFKGREGDWYLIIDSDEILGGKSIEESGITPLRQFLGTCESDCVDLQVNTPYAGGYDRAPRVFRHCDGINYKYTHYLVFYGKDLWMKRQVEFFKEATIWHMPQTRSEERKEMKVAYAKATAEYELTALDKLFERKTESGLDEESLRLIEGLSSKHRELMEKRGWLS